MKIKNPQILSEKIKFLRKLPFFLAKHLFILCLLAVFLAIVFSAIIFYNYVLKAENFKPVNIKVSSFFNEKNYETAKNFWEAQETAFIEADSKVFTNPFSSSQ